MTPAEMVSTLMDKILPLGEFALKGLVDLVDPRILRMPYSMPNVGVRVIAAGQVGVSLNQQDFQNSLEWPFEVQRIKFSQDPAHTPRDWRVRITDQSKAQLLMPAPVMVAILIDNNTGAWELKTPRVMAARNAWQIFIDNIDAINPITIDFALVGELLIPKPIA
jgi:hypothetical protein